MEASLLRYKVDRSQKIMSPYALHSHPRDSSPVAPTLASRGEAGWPPAHRLAGGNPCLEANARASTKTTERATEVGLSIFSSRASARWVHYGLIWGAPLLRLPRRFIAHTSASATAIESATHQPASWRGISVAIATKHTNQITAIACFVRTDVASLGTASVTNCAFGRALAGATTSAK